ncbi:transient receptor potential cation channel subfamily A member 1 homolog [Trichonephila inaurata madagascariensis]|uniref:Transient receptor potential cation channel subfamily A member 1 homolog n=1 Tax=Trichonephila inaurata madagascariensis TaxID=2747483 RepID=A0A8X6MAE7_9ARAC|nr:transient receptor potential cation channel subfamily A member 1 homolog [Trichonephila inaurata madagascariensis]
MSAQFAKVKYSLYNSDSVQAESDDDVGSESSLSNLNSKYISRKIKFCKETKVDLETSTITKSFDESEAAGEPAITLQQVLRDENLNQLRTYLDNLSLEACRLRINKLDVNKRAPLHYAARYNLVAATQLLIDRGADVNIEGEDGLTPLHFAARYGYIKVNKCLTEQSAESPIDESETVISVLIDGGAHVNCQDNYGMTPLHYAAMRGNKFATIQLLKSNKINTETSDKQEMTALHCAANYNSPDVVKFLLEAGAHPEATDENMSTPLHLAATTGSKKIIILLLNSVEEHGGHDKLRKYVDEKNISGYTALHSAVMKGHLDIVKILLEKGADVKLTFDHSSHPLHLAAVSGDVDIVKCLLQHGAAVNCVNNFGETPLHKAAAFNACEVIDFLLQNGAGIESHDNAHFTPLLIAVAEGHVEAIKTLLRFEADINVLDNMDRTVIFWAAQEDHPVSLMTLLKLGNSTALVDLVNRCDHYDNSPLHIAALKGYSDVTEILLKNGAEIERKNEHEQTPLHLASKHGHVDVASLFIKHNKTIVSTEDENANTPLHLAALWGHINMVCNLLNAGANIEARNCYLWTPLDCAASRGWKRCCQCLLNAGANVDSVDKSKATPLHLAARDGHRGVVKLLLKFGANIAQCDKNGKNCLDLAIDNGHEDVALEILSDPNWEAVLRNESDENKYGVHQTPLRRLIRQMPDVAEHVLDQCIVKNHFPEDHLQHQVTFNYEFLDDMFACYKPYLYDGHELSDTVSHSESTVFTGSNIYDDSGYVKNKVMPYISDKEILKYNHPLMLMVSYGREDLLSHPLCESLLRRKWKYYGRYVYYSNLLVFILFLIFLTGYVVTAVPPCPLEDVEEMDPNCCSLKNYTCQPYIGKCDSNMEQVFPRICRNFIYILALIHLLKEIYQIHQNGRRYLNLENALEWSCYLSALIFVADLTECSSESGIREVWQWELGSLSIFSAWMVLLMFISKFPFLGIYVIMFFQILSTFVNFSFVFFLFVVAFALGFYAVLQNQNPFENPGEAIIKTGVMMIGEIEFDAIFNEPDNKVYFKGPTYALFIIFLLIMAVIIMNLLIGLAVDDIKGVQEKAELKRLAMKVELVLTVERILPVVVLRKCIFKYRHFFPNSWKNYPWYLKCFRVNQTLTPKLPKNALDVVEEKQAKLSKQVKEIQETVFQVQKDVKHIIASMKKQGS